MPTLQDADAMTTEINDRLARVETHVEALVTSQTELRTDLKSLVASLAELAAELRHPDPSHCTKAEAIADLKTRATAAESRTTALEHRADRAEGGARVLLWLLGGGNLLGIGALIAWLIRPAG
jgi:predicted  nucleic acid-binding Zn-ribbon protein